MDADIDMKQAGRASQVPDAPADDLEQEAPWSPFPVSSDTCDYPLAHLVLRFPSRASLDQCLASLREASARRLGPYAEPFGALLDGMARSAKGVKKYEADYCGNGGRYYTEDGADCATCIPEDDAAALVRYLMDLVLLMDAGLAFGNEEV